MQCKVISPNKLHEIAKLIILNCNKNVILQYANIKLKTLYNIKKILKNNNILTIYNLSLYDNKSLFLLYKPNSPIFSNKAGSLTPSLHRQNQNKLEINADNLAKVFYENNVTLKELYNSYKKEAINNNPLSL